MDFECGKEVSSKQRRYEMNSRNIPLCSDLRPVQIGALAAVENRYQALLQEPQWGV
jgi:hypothetical protein